MAKRKIKGSVTASTMLFVTSGLMASFLGMRQYDRATSEMAWVTNSSLSAGQVVSANNLEQARVKEVDGAIANPNYVVGRRLAVAKNEGEVFRPNDFAKSRPVRKKTLSQHIPSGRVLFSLKLGASNVAPVGQFNAGDRLDILVLGRTGVRTAATDVQLVGVMKPPGAKSASANDGKITSLLPQPKKAAAGKGVTTLVLAVMPQHVYPLAHIGSQENVSIVLHSAHDIAAGQPVNVTPARKKRAVEVVEGLQRSTVYVGR